MTFSNEKRRHLLSGAVGAALLSACGGGGDEPPRSTASRERTTALAAPSQAVWSPTISLPLVPAAAASLPDGKVLFWSAEERFSFGNPAGRTYSAMFDPSNGSVTERTVTRERAQHVLSRHDEPRRRPAARQRRHQQRAHQHLQSRYRRLDDRARR